MLIITADDYGETALATDRILDCFSRGRVTSASAMVLMEDSERAAALARDTCLEIGLHLNLTEALTGHEVAEDLRRRQTRVSRYLNSHRFAQAVFNPLLAGAFRTLVTAQMAEFERLYGRPPGFVNGHHHMHLCTNVLWQRLLPPRSRLRAPFTFGPGEKGSINRCYRRLMARHVGRSFTIPDRLYSIQPIADSERLRRILEEARTKNVELEVHPADAGELALLRDPGFGRVLEGVCLRSFRHLKDQCRGETR